MTADPATIAVYDQSAAQYLEASGPEWEHTARTKFIARLPKGAYVLDLGCGPGHHAAAMIDAGMRVDAVDASAGMVAVARDRFGVPARQALFSDIDATDTYDAIWANFSLLHAPRDQMPQLLAQLHAALRAKGVFHIAFKLGTGAHRDSLTRLYTWWQEPQMRLALETAGFIVEDTTTRGKGIGLDKTPFEWAMMTAVKKD